MDEEFVVDSEHWLLIDMTCNDILMISDGMPFVFECEKEANDLKALHSNLSKFTAVQAKSMLMHQ